MPFKSSAERAWMWANKPDLAREWTDKYGSGGDNLPVHVKPKQKVQLRTPSRKSK